MKQYQDYYFRKAKAENYPARSIYKLRELDSKFGLLAKGIRALDLGASPGSWTLGCAEKIGPGGRVLACDLKPCAVNFPEHVVFMQADIFNPVPEFAQALAELGPFDLVLSDMAPATTGSAFTDQARSYNLANAAFELACRHLAQGGKFAVKIFMGPDAQTLQADMRKVFGKVKAHKPKSSRSESRETFFVGLEFRGLPAGPEAADSGF